MILKQKITKKYRKKSMDEALNFELKNKRYKVCRGINKLQNAKKHNVSRFKIATCENFQRGKCYVTG